VTTGGLGAAASLFGRTSRELPVAALNSKLRPPAVATVDIDDGQQLVEG